MTNRENRSRVKWFVLISRYRARLLVCCFTHQPLFCPVYWLWGSVHVGIPSCSAESIFSPSELKPVWSHLVPWLPILPHSILLMVVCINHSDLKKHIIMELRDFCYLILLLCLFHAWMCLDTQLLTLGLRLPAVVSTQ